MDAATHYQALGVDPSATAQEIRLAYRARARSLHPDVNTDADATARFTALKRAYDTLSDPAARARYDAALASHTAAANGAANGAGAAPRYSWSNIAQPPTGGRRGGVKRGSADPGDPTGFDELYEAFFAPRQAWRARHAQGKNGTASPGREDQASK